MNTPLYRDGTHQNKGKKSSITFNKILIFVLNNKVNKISFLYKQPAINTNIILCTH